MRQPWGVARKGGTALQPNPSLRSGSTSHANGRVVVQTVHVAVVVRTPMLREGIAMLLREEDAVSVDRLGATAEDIGDLDGVDVVVVAIDEVDAAVASVERLCALDPAVRIIGVHDGLPARQIGVLQDVGVSVLVDLSAGESAVIEAVLGTRARTLLRWDRPRIGALPLTDRERSVLSMLAGGAGSREIGDRLAISTHTVENYKQRLFRKLGATNQAQAVSIAIRLGLLGTAEQAQ